MELEADSIDDLLLGVYEHILAHGVINEPQKGKNYEIQGCQLVLSNPIARVSRSESRGLIFSCLGELFWYLSGSNNSSQIEYYLPRYKEFSESDGTIHGGYGKRLFDMHSQYNQVERIISQLKRSPSTRKAVIQLFDSSDLSEDYKDIPCTLNLQFTIREGKLNMFTMMRSNDAFMGLPHDMFVFTMLQELIASELNCKLGKYHHYAVSLHLYETNIDQANKFIQEGYMSERSVMQAMPNCSFSLWMNKILELEKAIRKGELTRLDEDIGLPTYWIDILKLLLFFNLTKSNEISSLREALATRNTISNSNFKTLIERRTRTHVATEAL